MLFLYILLRLILPCSNRIPEKPPVLMGFLNAWLYTDCKMSFVALISIKILVWSSQN